MSKDQKEICLYCKAWKLVTRGAGSPSVGECRRKSPIPTIGWYSTREGDWCLDFVSHPDDHEGPEHISKVADRVLDRIKTQPWEVVALNDQSVTQNDTSAKSGEDAGK